MESTDSRLSAEGLAELAQQVEANLAESTEQIRSINDDIHVLSINAKIESARAGSHGTGFGVVADHIRTLVARTNAVTEQMESRVRRLMGDLAAMSAQLGVEVRGQRFQQVAFNAIDIIDRNLYERSCDVRWWATDASLVDGLVRGTTEAAEHAGRRLGVILDSYTVYFDLVLADRSGTVVANGRPGRYRSLGSDVAQQPWFRQVLATRSGNEFAEQSVHRSALVGNEEILAYAATVRENGDADGSVLGVLGILFRWRDLADGAARRAVESIRDTEGEDIAVAAYVVDDAGVILAATEGAPWTDSLPPAVQQFSAEGNGHGQVPIGGRPVLAAYARSPGYETYRTGWRCVIAQTL